MDINVQKCLEYILDHERDDWIESGLLRNHVYFHAYIAYYGEKNANIERNNEIKFRKELDNEES